jgi:SAM-dependent methyltransferase
MDGEVDIRILEGFVPYEDGAESEVLGVLEHAADRSAGSEELARAIHDWPTQYHFALERSNILASVRMGPGDRVLDLGAGTGALSRAIGEAGAQVVALEGNLARAQALATRCIGLTNVEVVAGSLDEFRDSDGFDVVVAVGVLEYASSRIGGASGAQAFLEQAHSLVRPDGTLVLAIENQLGLRYLLGAPEDHLGKAYAGVEGYVDRNGPRTYSRRELHRMLTEAGFPHQWWAAPFPDYKLPTAIVSQAAYSLPDAARLIDQFVPELVSKTPFEISSSAAPDAVHRTFLQAGLALDVANSFLVVAAQTPGALGRVDDSVLLWRFDSGRRRRWCRTTSIHDTSAGRVIERQRTFDRTEPPAEQWLTQRYPAHQPFKAGYTLEQVVLEACNTGDLDAIDACLAQWQRFLSKHVTVESGKPRSCPFGAAVDETALPGRFLDVNLANFLESDDGLVYVDDEWQVVDSVSLNLVSLRALWYLARRILTSCATHPWSSSSSLERLTGTLAATCGVPGDALSIARFHAAECELQGIVTNTAPDQTATLLAAEGAYTAAEFRPVDELPPSALRHEIQELSERLRTTNDQLHTTSVRAAELDHELQRILNRAPARIYLQLKRRLARRRSTPAR